MFDIKNFIEDEIFFKKYNKSILVFYKNNKIQFYLKNSRTITGISEYYGKKNILVKIEEEYVKFFKKLEEKFLTEYEVDEKDFISLMKTNNNGSIIKLKVNQRKNNSQINIYNEYDEEILEDDLEKNENVNCLVEIDRFWNFNQKYGYIVLVRNIKKLHKKKSFNK